jgi:class 3 adenylate cyclase/tetratricopeptide (TPR) repeat protein
MAGRRERKVVTVLFVDLAGFTSRAEVMDPEDVAAMLDPYHERVKSELERRGGTVEKFIGDAVMAVFGAPVAHEDDAERAVRSALAIRDWAEQEGVELRVGINTGEALVTLDSRPEQGQTMATGDVVNTAARLQSAAPVGGILVGEQTVRATEHAIVYVEAEPIAAKGKAEPVPVWTADSARSRVSVERTHGASLVGRRRELELLFCALDLAREERSPQLVTLVGVPGIGKSRLVFELYHRVEEEEELTFWRHGRCLPYGDGVTFWALGEMVKAQAGILEGETEDEAARKLREAVDDPWIESHLRPLVGLAADAQGGSDRREEAFTAWRRFFESLADERPLVLVFEDLHWADDNLLDFVDHLVDWASAVPLLVVCTARPELLSRRPGWGGGKPNALTISLSPLTNADTARLLAELLDRSVLPAETQSELLDRAGGNPLYAEEYARILRERGQIERLPETVQGMIAARLDLLEADEKALVQDAAVVGRTFWVGALARLSGVDSTALEQRMHALERKEFIRRERAGSIAGEIEYSFRHLLVRDVAYGQIPRAERAERHRRAADWIAALGRPDDHSEMLAYHYLQALELGAAAGVDTREFAGPAAVALTAAGDRAFGLNAFDAAARHYRTALELLPAGDARRGRLLLGLGTALFNADKTDLPLLEAGVEELLAVGDIDGAADAERILSWHLWVAGERDSAFAHLERGLALVADSEPSAAKANVVGTAARFRMLAADDQAAIRYGREALEMATELGLDELRAAVLNNVGTARMSMGDDGGLADLREAIDVARKANAGFELSRAGGNLASMLWTRGELTAAAERWQQAQLDGNQYGQTGIGRWMQGINTTLFYDLGRWDDALATAEAFIAEVEGGAPHYLSSQAYLVRGLIRLARGETAAVGSDAEKAVELAQRAKDPQILYQTLAAAARLHHELGDDRAAFALIDEFMAAIAAGEGLGFSISWTHVLAWTAAEAARGAELAAALSRGYESPWAHAAIAYARGEPAEAADLCAEMGAVTQEAYARLAAARMLVDAGRRAEADVQLGRALAFYRGVGARRYVLEGETLLAASA